VEISPKKIHKITAGHCKCAKLRDSKLERSAIKKNVTFERANNMKKIKMQCVVTVHYFILFAELPAIIKYK